MPSPILPILVFSLLLLSGLGPALAACTDTPAPKVDWRRCLQDGQDFQGVDLTGAVLRDASFSRAILNGAMLGQVEAPEARFTSADMAGADLTGANLRGADFTRTLLRGAKLAGADLRRARFFNADLTDADLTGAQLNGADLSTAILDNALWTDGVKRCAAASIGICR